MKQITKRWMRSEQGSMLILGAAGLVALLAIIGGAVDIARYMNVNSKFKDAADTALLSAAAVSRSQDVNAVAMEYFEANFPPEYLDSLILNDIVVTADPVNMEWTATVTGEVKMAFAAFMGVDTIPLEHKVTVAWDVANRMEVLFTVDTSASMCMDVSRSTEEDGAFVMAYSPDYRCKKLNAMKEAMNYVIDNGLSIIQGIGGPSFYAGIIPFNHKVRLPDVNNVPAPLLAGEMLRKYPDPVPALDEEGNPLLDIEGNPILEEADAEELYPWGDPDYYKDFENAEPLSPVIPLMGLSGEDKKNELKVLINGIVQSPTGKGWTRSNIAALTAALMLDKDYYQSFGGEKPHDFDPETVDKVVVMMTDGANMGCCYAAHPEGRYDNQYLYLYQADNAHLTGLDDAPDMEKWAQAYNIPDKGLCTQMKERGITIYSVIYDVDDRDPGGAEIKDAYRKCASNDQFFFDVQNEDDLKLAYKSIAQSFLKLRIIY